MLFLDSQNGGLDEPGIIVAVTGSEARERLIGTSRDERIALDASGLLLGLADRIDEFDPVVF